MQHLQPNTTLQGGKYRIERRLGQGGFGITYLAVQTSLNRYVAIKELFIGGQGQAINDRRGNQVVVTNDVNLNTFLRHKEKFKKEALRLSNLQHRNLVKVHEYFEENGTAYYVMDYIEGESLRDKVNREGALPETLVTDYLYQLISVLAIVHRQYIWHLDLKPDNIMVDWQNRIYVIDFGASKHIEQETGMLSTSSMLAYTPGYYPPEQSESTLRNIGAWTDIYALGATLYNLLTRIAPPPFSSIISEGERAFSFTSNVSPKMRILILSMMRISRYDRPQNVGDIAAFLNENVVDEGTLMDVGVRSDNRAGASSNDASQYVSREMLEREALSYFEQNDVRILDQYGYFRQKKKRQASVIWASCIISFLISLFAAFVMIEYFGWNHFGVAGMFIYTVVALCGTTPGLYLGPAIMGIRDESQFAALREDIKRNFVEDYVVKHSKNHY